MTRSMQKKLVVQGNLGILYSRSGRFAKARECFEETIKILRYFSSPVFEIAVKMTEYNLIFETGDYAASILLAEEINKSALKLKNRQYIQLSYQFLGECSYYLDNNESAFKYLELAEKYIDSTSENDRILNLLLKTISKIDSAANESSEKELLKVYDYLSSIGSNYDRSIAGFYLAKCYQLNNPETCRQFLETVFALSREKGYFSFLFREYIRSAKIFELAGKKHKASVMEFLAQAEEVSELNWISESYRDKLKKFIDNKYDLKMLAFGGLKFILKGEEIPEKKWLRKKRKLLLGYVMIFRTQTLSKDKIVDMFFGDTPVESIDNTFHQAVSNLRTALRIDSNDTEKKEKNNYILYEDKTLRLNNLYNYYSDLEDFDNLIKKAFSAQNNIDCIEYLLKASSLYSGNVLEGYYEDWCESLREEYKSKFIKSAEKLIELLTEQNRTDEIIIQAERLNIIDNLNIASIKAIILANIKQGKHTIARSRFEKFIALYEDEIGEKPAQTILNEIESLFKK
jgi:DNA-binding SARP family transcriptional activator